jgi:hypothetical protein
MLHNHLVCTYNPPVFYGVRPSLPAPAPVAATTAARRVLRAVGFNNASTLARPSAVQLVPFNPSVANVQLLAKAAACVFEWWDVWCQHGVDVCVYVVCVCVCVCVVRGGRGKGREGEGRGGGGGVCHKSPADVCNTLDTDQCCSPDISHSLVVVEHQHGQMGWVGSKRCSKRCTAIISHFAVAEIKPS